MAMKIVPKKAGAPAQSNPFCFVGPDGIADAGFTICNVQAGLQFLRESTPDQDHVQSDEAEAGRVFLIDTLHAALAFALQAQNKRETAEKNP